jgi:hypothetical protein
MNDIATMPIAMNASIGHTDPGVTARQGSGVSNTRVEVATIARARANKSLTATEKRKRFRTTSAA